MFRRTVLLGFALAAGAATTAVLLAPVMSPATAQTTSQNARVTKKLSEALHERVRRIDGKPVAIQITPTSRAGQGEFARITAKHSPIRIGDLYAQEASFDARNVKIDVPYLMSKGKIRTTRAQTTMRVVISETDLTKVLREGNSTENMNLRVKFLPNNRMRVTGDLKFPLLNGPVVGTGRFEKAANAPRVNLEIESLTLRGASVPKWLVDRFENSINPIIDYRDLPFNPPFKTFKIVGNKAYLTT